jgi:integrase
LDHKIEHSSPKTERGRRSLSVDPVNLAALRAHRARQLEERLAAGMGWTDTGFVFTKDDGAPYHPQSLSSAFRRHARRAGLPAIRYHDLRHSYATAALVAGVRPKVVSARLGHANIQITLDTYSHILPEMDQEAADAIATLILGEAVPPRASAGTPETPSSPASGAATRSSPRRGNSRRDPQES